MSVYRVPGSYLYNVQLSYSSFVREPFNLATVVQYLLLVLTTRGYLSVKDKEGREVHIQREGLPEKYL